ncbi:MAG: tryptophan--tRNA ligase [Candidatus Blackburnbacteria bacterium]|nr:tryptophan--tRNA ligase [Candidatus Blackburnbacteria bacterium]
MNKKRVLSGIRANGRLHLGNYLGAVKGMLELQNNLEYETFSIPRGNDLLRQLKTNQYDLFYMVADLHSINVPYNPKGFQQAVREVVLDYLAAGLDPQKCTLFIQSHVPEHVELSYLFSTTVTVARMLHLPTYKEKVKQHPENVNMALLYYPVLMAADILAYKSNLVPVGDDQLPHLEVAREIARKMNDTYGLDFPEPEQFKTKGSRVPSLTGEGKMSKSVEGSYINLTDDIKTIKKKLAAVPTDSGQGEKVPETGGVAALLQLVELFQGFAKKEEYERQYVASGVQYRVLKEELTEAIYKELEPIQERRSELEKDKGKVDRIIEEGAKKAREVASQTLQEVKLAMGLIMIH